jgi:hypothetical protein
MLAGALACALGAWLLAPIHAARALRGLDVCLVDVSASVVRTRPGWRDAVEAWLRAERERAAASDHDSLAVAYARDVAVVDGGALEAVARDGLASDLAAALDAVEALRGGRAIARVALWGDREWTGRDPSRALAELASDGARIEWAEPPVPTLSDAALVELRAPPRVEPGAPLSVAAVVAVRTRGELAPELLRIACDVRDSAGSREVARLVPWRESDGPHALRIDLGAAREGWTSIRARVSLQDGAMADPIAENDVASASVLAGEKPVLGVVAARAETLEAILAAPLEASLTVRSLAPNEVAAALADLDLLAALDVDPRDLPLELVDDFVRRGGGFLACGGDALLAGLMAAPPALAWLPVELDPGDDAARDVILLADRSGSMSGEPFDAARAAAVELALAAPASDAVAIRCFTDRLDAPVELRAAGEDADRARVEARVRSLAPPSGPTDVTGALEAFAAERAGASRRALALLLTDGRDQTARGATPERCASLRGKLEAARVQLEVLAFGDRADVEFLGQLAGPRGLRRASGSSDLAAVFVRAVAAGFVLDEPGSVFASEGAAPGSIAREVADAMRASGGGALPPIDRLLAVRPKPDAEVAAATADGRTAIAMRRHGVGVAAVFASSPEERWAPAWRGAAGAWGPLLRALSRGRAAAAPQPSVTVRSGVMALGGVPRDWPARVKAEIALHGAGERGEVAASAELAPPPTAPGADPRTVRVGRLEAERTLSAGTAEARLFDEQGRVLATLVLDLPVPEELAYPPRRVELAAAERDPGVLRPREPGARGSARRLGLAWTAAGVAALAFGALLRLRPGQAARGSGR